MKMQAERLTVIEPVPLPLHEKRFDDAEQLSAAIEQDVRDARAALGTT